MLSSRKKFKIAIQMFWSSMFCQLCFSNNSSILLELLSILAKSCSKYLLPLICFMQRFYNLWNDISLATYLLLFYTLTCGCSMALSRHQLLIPNHVYTSILPSSHMLLQPFKMCFLSKSEDYTGRDSNDAILIIKSNKNDLMF